MAETVIELPGGGRATISGTPQEIAEVLRLAGFGTDRRAEVGPVRGSTEQRPLNGGPIDKISGLRNEGFFSQGRGLADVQNELRARGHIYEATSLSPALIRLVRRRALGRVKGARGRWLYVNR